MMDKSQFWNLIETARKKARGEDLWEIAEQQAEHLTKALQKLPADQIKDFGLRFEDYMQKAYQAKLWDAAIIINEGCSDDGFEYFRAWLISMGEYVYQEAVRDPDTLARYVEEEIEAEDILYCAFDAYKHVTKKDINIPQNRADLVGEFIEDEDELQSTFPLLWEVFMEEYDPDLEGEDSDEDDFYGDEDEEDDDY